MPVLPSVQHYITSEETEFEAPVSEALAQNIGETLNYLNDLFTGNFVEFTSNDTFLIPGSVTKIVVKACGGGGGGGAGGGSGSPGQGGTGGRGSVPSTILREVVAGDMLTISIGAGGAAGSNGGNTTISGTLPSAWVLTFKGGTGGVTGGTSLAINPALSDLWTPQNGLSGGGKGGYQAPTQPDQEGGPGSGSHFYPSGGAKGEGFAGGGGRGGGGGGGGAGMGPAGNGGDAGSGSGQPGTAATGYGSGGGGGAGATTGSPGAGGAGMSGYVAIAWF